MCAFARKKFVEGSSPPQNAVEDIGGNLSSGEAGNFRLRGSARTRHIRIVAEKLCPRRELSRKYLCNSQIQVGSHPDFGLRPSWATSSPRFCRLFVLPVADEVIDHGRIGQSRGVAEVAVLIFGDLAQDSSHDFAGARFWQARRELDQIRRGNRSDLLADPSHQFLAQVFSRLFAGHQGDIGVDALTFDVVRVTDYPRFRNFRMRNECALDFGGAEAVSSDIDDIVDASGDPVVAIFVATAAVTREIFAGIGLEVRIDETLVVAIDSAHLSGPRIDDAEIAARCAALDLAFGVDNFRLHTEERTRCGTWLESGCTWQRRDEDAAGFGLPPGVDNRTTIVADHVVVPLPGFRVDRFTDGAE